MTMEHHVPRRGDAVESWIKAKRDEYVQFRGEWDIPGSRYYDAYDDLLEDYRLHADTRMPIDQDVTDWPGVR